MSLLCVSSSFWQLGWRNSSCLGFVILWAEQCDSIRSSVQVWHMSLIGFIRTEDWILCLCLSLQQSHLHPQHVLQHSSTCMCPPGRAHHALRQVALTHGLWSLRCVSPPEHVFSCVWHTRPHPSLPHTPTACASWGILTLLQQSSLGSMEVLSCPDLELPPLISKWCHSWRL